ncbi:MAG: hypothetical protein JXA94_01360 [Parachlamydiales bacterium]|nr:hypothetical protein [Parachlamydiales bacterium]
MSIAIRRAPVVLRIAQMAAKQELPRCAKISQLANRVIGLKEVQIPTAMFSLDSRTPKYTPTIAFSPRDLGLAIVKTAQEVSSKFLKAQLEFYNVQGQGVFVKTEDVDNVSKNLQEATKEIKRKVRALTVIALKRTISYPLFNASNQIVAATRDKLVRELGFLHSSYLGLPQSVAAGIIKDSINQFTTAYVLNNQPFDLSGKQEKYLEALCGTLVDTITAPLRMASMMIKTGQLKTLDIFKAKTAMTLFNPKINGSSQYFLSGAAWYSIYASINALVEDKKLSKTQRVAASGLAGMSASLGSYPLSVANITIQSCSIRNELPLTLMQALKKQGFRGSFRGIGPAMFAMGVVGMGMRLAQESLRN